MSCTLWTVPPNIVVVRGIPYGSCLAVRLATRQVSIIETFDINRIKNATECDDRNVTMLLRSLWLCVCVCLCLCLCVVYI